MYQGRKSGAKKILLPTTESVHIAVNVIGSAATGQKGVEVLYIRAQSTSILKKRSLTGCPWLLI